MAVFTEQFRLPWTRRRGHELKWVPQATTSQRGRCPSDKSSYGLQPGCNRSFYFNRKDARFSCSWGLYSEPGGSCRLSEYLAILRKACLLCKLFLCLSCLIQMSKEPVVTASKPRYLFVPNIGGYKLH